MRPSDRVSVALPLGLASQSSRVPCRIQGNWAKEQDSTGGEGRMTGSVPCTATQGLLSVNSAESSEPWASLWLPLYSAWSIFQEVRLRWNQWELEVTQVLLWSWQQRMELLGWILQCLLGKCKVNMHLCLVLFLMLSAVGRKRSIEICFFSLCLA